MTAETLTNTIIPRLDAALARAGFTRWTLVVRDDSHGVPQSFGHDTPPTATDLAVAIAALASVGDQEIADPVHRAALAAVYAATRVILSTAEPMETP